MDFFGMVENCSETGTFGTGITPISSHGIFRITRIEDWGFKQQGILHFRKFFSLVFLHLQSVQVPLR